MTPNTRPPILALFLVAVVACRNATSPDHSREPDRAPLPTTSQISPTAKLPNRSISSGSSTGADFPGADFPANQPARPLAELATLTVPARDPVPPADRLPEIDDAALQQLGIRKVRGKHLALYTDLPGQPAVDELPTVFDSAVPQWCAYFEIPNERAEGWRIVGYLIQDKERFKRAGLLPDQLPPFLNGYHRGAEIWLYEQPSAYYRRHLMLHEGTHAFMTWGLGGTGPPWYMEGTAELCGTHRWHEGQLTLRYIPRAKEEVLEWGRIKIVRDDLRAGRPPTLTSVLHYDSRAHLRVEPYGWCWATAAFFDGHPRYQQRFHQLKEFARERGDSFSERFLTSFQEDAQLMRREWQWFITNLDYGYDVAREAVQPKRAAPLPVRGSTLEIAADRGWQSTGIQLEGGKSYRLKASGRFALTRGPRPWWSEPDGVTLRYHRGQPLGMLLGAIIEETDPAATENGFLLPMPLGAENQMTAARSGTLYLRINDAPNQLDDNQGRVIVKIERRP